MKPEDPPPDPTRTAGSDPTVGPDSHDRRPDHLPAWVGPYRVLGVLGEGGMGLVLEAEQQQPRRRVALKMIRAGGFAGERSRLLFQREVETLSRLKHPNIAAIHDAGTAEDGQPFLVMELVAGLPLDDYAKRHRPQLDTEELAFRLRLIQRICLAVHHAHQRGVIHRDLKPANLLVSTELTDAEGIPVVKILDFGLARLTDVESPGELASATGIVKGTLAYMSPEQARGHPDEIDTRTDVYALGVVLYELLTGSRPHLLQASSFIEATRTISEDPPRALRDSWPAHTVRLDDDLETLAGAALATDRERRYSGADALARDIGRYLRHEPIEARAPSASYQFKKFAQRNRALVGGIVGTGLALAAGIVATTVFGLREAAQRREAELARGDLQEVVEFQSRMLADVDPERTGLRVLRAIDAQLGARGEASVGGEARVGGEASVGGEAGVGGGSLAERFAAIAREINPADLARGVLDENLLEPAARAADREFADRPLIRARLHHTLAGALGGLGLYDRAEAGFRQAAELRAGALGERDPATLESRGEVVGMLFRQGQLDEAEAQVKELLEQQRMSGDDRRRAALALRYTQAAIRYARGDYGAAQRQYTDVLAEQQRLLGPEHADVLATRNGLGILHHRRGAYDEAAAEFSAVLDARLRNEGPEDPETLAAMLNLASVRTKQQRHEEAERLLIDASEAQSRTLGAEHPRTLRTLNNLAHLYAQMGRLDEAHVLDVRTLHVRERVLGPDHPDTLRSLNNLAYRLVTLGRPGEAERILVDLLARDERVQSDSPDHAIHLHTYAELLVERQRWSEARRALDRAVRIYRRVEHANLTDALALAARLPD